ncbi:drug metabolite transporter permease [Stylonychia lemnae]|uniref:Drug metabolite transporter permease n=1 Tax=Stylonychia lemnae TaxID=5949 RepID=A0A078BE85_STYLE|nr:drug metabolite transporter permease [Stylonychia lemnae]|eukprot:CDW91868.1 drug metabolite transporter permease [Stylonychia lemnae]
MKDQVINSCYQGAQDSERQQTKQYYYQSVDHKFDYSEDENDDIDHTTEASDDTKNQNDFQKMDIVKQNQVLNEQYPGLIKLFDLNRAKGQLWMMIAALMTTIMNLIIKEQSKTSKVNVLQAVIVRSLFLAAGCYAHLKKDGKNVIDFPQPLGKYIFMRAVFGFCGSTCFYVAIDYLNLSMAVSLYYTSPIITATICYFLLGEKLGRLEIVGIFSAMFGVLLLTQPYLIFTNPDTSPHMTRVKQPIDNKFLTGVFFAIFGSFNNALVFLVCRKIGKDIHQSIHPFYFAMMSAVGATLALFLSNIPSYPLSRSDFIMLSLCGLCSWVQQEGQSISLQYEKAARSAAINYLVVFNSFVIDALLFGETVKTSDLLGALFIIFFTLLNAILKCFGKAN